MGNVNLAGEQQFFSDGVDSIVIRHYVAGIAGGRTLDMTDFPEDVVKAGHIVIRSTKDETVYKPMPVADGQYSSLPADFEYAGVVVASKPKSAPFVGIMYSGEVNDLASPYRIDSIKAALKTALPTLVFLHD